MKMSTDRILTSHSGSLPRPDELIEANRVREAGETIDEKAFQAMLQEAVVDIVRRQKEIGIDMPGDGEFGKSMGHRTNYRAWWSYCFDRLNGLDWAGQDFTTLRRSGLALARSHSPAPRTAAIERSSRKSMAIRKAGRIRGRARLIGRSVSGPSPTKGKRRSKPTSPILRRRSRLAGLKKAS